MRGNRFSWAVTLGLAFCLLSVNACTDAACPQPGLTKRSVLVGGYKLTVEIAATPSERACGLSLRDSLPVNHGMLFVYRNDRIRDFWMKDTRIPLTIAFLDADGRISELVDMDPGQPEHRYRSGGPFRYALETQQGWFHARGVRVGATVDVGSD